MNKLKLRSTLNHKATDHSPYNVEVEKVVTLYGNDFENMKSKPYENNPYIAANKDLMFIDSNEIVHGVLFVDDQSGEGILVESEGYEYARKSQFIPNAKALIRQNEMTDSEIMLHNQLKELAETIAGYAHSGRKSFDYEELSYNIDANELIFNVLSEMLEQSEDIKQAEIAERELIMNIEPEPLQELKFYCPLKIIKEAVEPLFDDEEYEESEEVSPEYAIGCKDEVNRFIENGIESNEEHVGIMAYYDDNPVIKEKVFSAFISVDNINDRLMGVITVQVSGELTDSELEEFREYLTGQMSDGVGESLEQRKITTSDYGDIYVSFWNSGNDWSMQTEEEFNMSQTEEPEMNMSM